MVFEDPGTASFSRDGFSRSSVIVAPYQDTSPPVRFFSACWPVWFVEWPLLLCFPLVVDFPSGFFSPCFPSSSPSPSGVCRKIRNQLLMSSRVTRSAARLAAESPQSASSGPSSVIPAAGSAQSRPRKRKAPSRLDRSLEAQTPANPPSPRRRSSKRQRVAISPSTATAPAPAVSNRGSRNRSAMSQPG